MLKTNEQVFQTIFIIDCFLTLTWGHLFVVGDCVPHWHG